MSAFPFWTGYTIEAAGANTATSGGTAILGGTANTKGNFVQLVASTTYDATGFFISTHLWHTSYLETAIDIAIGAAGSEQIILPDVMAANIASGGRTTRAFFPIAIPAGTRISARSQANAGSMSPYVLLTLANLGSTALQQANKATAYGFNSASTRGTQYVTSGASTNVKGAWQELTGSTSTDHSGIVLYEHNYTGVIDNACLTDFGIGAAGSEVVVVPNLMSFSELSDIFANSYLYLPISIPAGTRLAFRTQSSRSSGSNVLSMVAYGLS